MLLKIKQLLFVCLSLFLLNVSNGQTIVYVTQNGSGLQDGTSWINAASSTQLQSYIESALPNTQIWVGAGIYKPTAYPLGCSTCSSNRDYAYYLPQGVSIYGSFSGDETSITQRNIDVNRTTFSGEINGASINDNSRHMFIHFNGTTTDSVFIDGFTIDRVYDGTTSMTSISFSNGAGVVSQGAGLYISSSLQPFKISNITFTANTTYIGGAISIINTLSEISNCRFENNGAYSAGGAVSINGQHTNTNVSINNCVFKSNKSVFQGGAILVSGSNFTTNPFTFNISKSFLISNECGEFGGGAMVISNGRANINTCVFYNNKTTFNNNRGECLKLSYLKCSILNSTFYTAIGTNKPCFYADGVTDCILRNTILSTPSSSSNFFYTLPDPFSDVSFTQYNSSIGPNLQNLFLSREDVDGLDNVLGTIDDGLTLRCSAPQKDVGDVLYSTPTDIIGTPRPQFGGVDIGAYENTETPPSLPISVDITSSVIPCMGSTPTFTATTTNQAGPITYQWKLNNVNAGTNSDTYTSPALSSSANTIKCEISTLYCSANPTATSNIINAIYNDNLSVAITSLYGNSICQSVPAVFQATATNAGISPSYQWKVNGANAGTDTSFFSTTIPSSGTIVSCEITASNEICLNNYTANSNNVVMTVLNEYPDGVIYVKGNANGLNDGTSWENAYTNLQPAIDVARYCGLQVWVAAGTYKPNAYPEGCVSCLNSRHYTYRLKGNVSLYGGFWGNETQLSQRNYISNITTLSGDIGTAGNITDNCYHVMVAIGNDAVSIIDGFYITGANANASNSNKKISGYYIPDMKGGGLHVQYSDLQIENCFFTNNKCAEITGMGEALGAGVYMNFSSSLINNCTFSQNTFQEEQVVTISYDGGAGLGINNSNIILKNSTFSSNKTIWACGGALNSQNCALDISNCKFVSNEARHGGGVYISSNTQKTVLKNCDFISNKANTLNLISQDAEGGGLYVNSNVDTITGCVFFNNSAGYSGGGIYIRPVSSNLPINGVLINCVMANNTALYGGGIYSYKKNIYHCNVVNNTATSGGAGIFNMQNTTVLNSIVWGNTGSPIHNQTPSSPANITHSIISGGYAGTGNLALDPKFVTIGDKDGSDNIWRTADDGLMIKCISPARDAGSNTSFFPPTDILGNIRNQIPDIGAYEQLDSYVTPSVAIIQQPSDSCEGIPLSFTATATNGGTAPVYQWKKNGTNIGSNSNAFSSAALIDGNIISCVLASSEICADNVQTTSNLITLVLNPQPAIPVISWNGTSLESSYASGNQWNNAGGPIAGATNNVFSPSSNDVYTVTYTSPDGCSSTSLPYSSFVGVEENNLSHNINIFPNPTSGLLNITGFPASSTVQVMDVSGRFISRQGLSTGSIDLSAVVPGIYQLIIEYGSGSKTYKIIKVN